MFVEAMNAMQMANISKFDDYAIVHSLSDTVGHEVESPFEYVKITNHVTGKSIHRLVQCDQNVNGDTVHLSYRSMKELGINARSNDETPVVVNVSSSNWLCYSLCQSDKTAKYSFIMALLSIILSLLPMFTKCINYLISNLL